jgi:hypothetical protein
LVFGREGLWREQVDAIVLQDLLYEEAPDLLALLRSEDFNPNNVAQVNSFLNNARAVVTDWLRAHGFTGAVPQLRIHDMTGKSYQIHTATLNHLMGLFPANTPLEGPGGAYEQYRLMHLDERTNPAAAGNWVYIQPTIEGGVATWTIRSIQAPGGPVRPNTSYIIFIRPYEDIAPNLRLAFYPSYILVTTPDDRERPIPDPTTPVLIPVPEFTSRRSVGVRWRIQGGLNEDGLPADITYELRWSEFIGDYPNGGTLVTWDDIVEAIMDPNDPSGIRELNGFHYIFFRLDGLFVDTLHYLWARGLNVVDRPSHWSNPVDIRTLNIEPPAPPRSLGQANQGLLELFNRLNNTEYSAADPHAMHIVWMRIHDDMLTGNPRAESGVAAGGIARPLNLPQEQYGSLFMVRFEELAPNRRYYVRARTVLTVQRGGSDGLTETFNYIVQMADNEDFLDPITFTIGPLADISGANAHNARRAESPWVNIEVDTGLYDGEYDGAHRPEQYPLPERDWEITYDHGSQTLTWRFRTNQIGADGRPDHNVDQRFISRLIAERVFTFTIDMSNYRGLPITNRDVILPLSIMRAFEERQITLVIDAGDIQIAIPPGAFNTADVRSLGMGIGSDYLIRLSANPSGLPNVGVNNRFTMPPQRLAVTARTPQRTLNMDSFARPIGVILPMDTLIAPHGEHAALFYHAPHLGGWQDLNGQYSFVNNTITGHSQRPGTFAGVTREAPPATVPNHPSYNAMRRVTSRITITDMTQFNPSEPVSVEVFNNFVNALAHNRTSVTMFASMSSADSRDLGRARLLAPNNSREATIDVLVRLYELQTQRIIQPMTNPATLPGFGTVSAPFQQSMLKAADIGFITGTLMPQGVLTMGDLMIMLDIIIQDAGL